MKQSHLALRLTIEYPRGEKGPKGPFSKSYFWNDFLPSEPLVGLAGPTVPRENQLFIQLLEDGKGK